MAETNGFLTLNEFSPCQGMTQYKEIGSFLTLLRLCLHVINYPKKVVRSINACYWFAFRHEMLKLRDLCGGNNEQKKREIILVF